jgi:hypothetical protein
VGWQLYSAPIGSPEDGYAEAFGSWAAVWSNHAELDLADGSRILGPKAPHPPPYDAEAEHGVVAAGFERGNDFTKRSWLPPAGIALSAAIVPWEGAPRGSSPDFDDGAVITESVSIAGELHWQDTLVAPLAGLETPLVGAALPATPFDGWSHVILNFAESTASIPDRSGNYEFELTLTDGVGSGWSVRVPFSVQ